MIRAFVLACAALVAMPLLTLPASAQNMPQVGAQTPLVASDSTPLLMLTRGKPTHPERVILFWHKMVQQTPDFAMWAKKSPFLRTANVIDRDTIINSETNRLQQAWNDFDSSELINVQTVIHLNNYSTLQEQLFISEFTSKTFFSFMMYDENVAIVPKDIAEFGKIKITKAQMEEMLKKATGGQVTAELLLKPVEADAKTPFVQNKMSYWLILAQVAEIRFWSTLNGKSELLWMHRADDYKPKEDKSLLDLKAGTMTK